MTLTPFLLWTHSSSKNIVSFRIGRGGDDILKGDSNFFCIKYLVDNSSKENLIRLSHMENVEKIGNEYRAKFHQKKTTAIKNK